MRETPIDLVTISREYGAGGSELAVQLGKRLEWPVLDRQLVQEVATRLNYNLHTVEAMDEHPPGLLERISSALMMSPPESPMPIDLIDLPSPDVVAKEAIAAIKEAGANPPLIVVGHGAQCIFGGRRGTLHVRLVAPLQSRIDRIRSRIALSEDEAVAEVARMDTDRANYLRRYFGCEWRDPLLYDLQINTGRVPIAEAVRVIVEIVRPA